MIEPTTIAGGFGIVRNGWALFQQLRSMLGDDVLTALFDPLGSRLEGSDKIKVELHSKDDETGVWWYSVAEPLGYAFLREPVVPSCCYELVGTEVGEKNPDARFWRWIAPVLPGRIYGSGEVPNIKTDFLIFAYRPAALLKPAKK